MTIKRTDIMKRVLSGTDWSKMSLGGLENLVYVPNISDSKGMIILGQGMVRSMGFYDIHRTNGVGDVYNFDAEVTTQIPSEATHFTLGPGLNLGFKEKFCDWEKNRGSRPGVCLAESEVEIYRPNFELKDEVVKLCTSNINPVVYFRTE